MSDLLARLRTALPSSVRLEEGDAAMPRLAVRTAAATAEVYVQGAHVTAWQPVGARMPVLWTSRRSLFEAGRPIRGGVPVCFPWFGAHRDAAAPMHGFARLRPWELVGAGEDADGTVTLEFELAGEGLAPQWPHRFAIRHRIRIGTALRLELEVENTGGETFTFEEALHSYFRVTDIRQVTVSGLEDAEYLDKVAGLARRPPASEAVRFAGETDRIYLDTRADCVVRDPRGGREVLIEKAGSDATVLWNPWIDKARAMPDFGDDEWTEMVCVETGNVNAHERTLAPGASHSMTSIVRVRDSTGS